jgi:hypothetical protein
VEQAKLRSSTHIEHPDSHHLLKARLSRAEGASEEENAG